MQSALVVGIAAAVAIGMGVVIAQPHHDGGGVGSTTAGGIKIRVGVLPVVDVAPFYRALAAGYFTHEGLDVEPVTTTSGPEAIEALAAGRLDVAFTSYPGILKAQSENQADLKIIAPAYTALPGHLELVVPPNGVIQKPRDIAGRRIAVTSPGSISDLGAISELQSQGVDAAHIQWIATPMPEMGAAMQRGDVDGAVVAEPYITLTDKQLHARPILDIAVGKTHRIPVSGWAAHNESPDVMAKTAGAFVRALRRGVDDMADRTILNPLLAEYLGIDVKTATEVRIAEYTKDLDAAEIQRVADLMKEHNVIHQPLDVRPMLFSP